MTFRAALFDLDGTLIDSTAAVVRAWLTWAAEYGISPQALANSQGRPSSAIVAELVPAEEVEAALRRIDYLELTDVDGVTPLPGALSTLESMTPDSHAIVTSCNRPLATARIAAADLPAPPIIVTADDVRHGKPDPEPFLTAAARLGAAPERCVVIEDAPAGVAAARAAGMTAIGVQTNDGPTGDLDLGAADLVAKDLTQLRWSRVDGQLHVELAG